MLYFLAFTSVPTLLYITYGVLSYCDMLPDKIGTVFTVMASLSVVLRLFYDNISMLYFGRLYRKYFSGRLSDWPILCYSVLTILNIFFIFFISGNGGLYNAYVNSCGFMYAVYIINIIVPVMVVPLLLSFRVGNAWMHLICSICVLYASTAGWILFGGIVFQSLGENSSEIFGSLPFSWFITETAPSESTFVVLCALFIICAIVGYVLHALFIAKQENRVFSRVFLPMTYTLLSLSLISYMVLLCMTFIIDKRNASSIASLENTHGITFRTSNVEKQYLNMEKPNEQFWKAFIENAKNPDSMARIDQLLDGVSELPKFNRIFERSYSGVADDLEAVAAFRLFNSKRMDDALQKKDVDSAMKYYKYDCMLDNALLGDVYAVAAVQRMSYGDKSTLALLKSGLLDETQLGRMHKECYNREAKAALLLKRVSFWYDFCFVTLTEKRAEECFIEIPSGKFIPFVSIRFSKYLFPQLYYSYYKSLNDSLKNYKNNSLDTLRNCTFKQERELLIAVSGELFKCRRGRYPREISELFPDLLPVLPVNPFNGKPLEYTFK